MTDATILIPTHRHAAFLPYAVRSALTQEGVDLELFVVGDGVEDETRAALAPYLDDPRVRFFDFAKGQRHGERHRHVALAEAVGRIVCYLSDDDLLLPDHVAEMARLLDDADFAHSAPASILDTGELWYAPFDLARPEFAWHMRSGASSIGLTGAAHTLAAYRRLPYGWRTTPPGYPTDLYTWLQWLDLPGFRGVTSERLTHLHFPDPFWRRLPVQERVIALEDWFRRSREPGFADELHQKLLVAIRRAGENERISARKAELMAEEMIATRTWRLRGRLIRIAPVRALLARRQTAR